MEEAITTLAAADEGIRSYKNAKNLIEEMLNVYKSDVARLREGVQDESGKVLVENSKKQEAELQDISNYLGSIANFLETKYKPVLEAYCVEKYKYQP